MRLNSVIIADDSADCNICELCVGLKDSTIQLLNQYQELHNNVAIQHLVLLSEIDKNHIAEELSKVNQDYFISFWYGHGNKNAFWIANEDIISTTDNYYLFSNALVYTFSCYVGLELAKAVVDNGAKVFVGYASAAECPWGLDDTTTTLAMVFVDSFVKGKSVNDSVSDLREAYNNAVYDDNIDPLLRGYFQKNRDALVLKGDGELTINDMLIQ